MTPSEESLVHAGLKLLSHEIYLNATSHGFYDEEFKDYLVTGESGVLFPVSLTPVFKAKRIALITSELSEALEGIRKPHPDQHCPEFSNEEIELADAIIRILDYGVAYNLKLTEAIFAKMKFNESRSKMHGGKAF